jgi:hypothetical protein
VIPRGQDRQVCSGYVRAESRWTNTVASVLLDGKEAGAILHPSYTIKIAGPMAKGRHQPAQESAKTVIVDEMLPFGTSEDARAETERLIRTLGKGGGYILGPSHAIQAGKPAQNITAMFDAALRHYP